MQVAPPVLIITGLRVIITTGVKLHQINIHIHLISCSRGGQHKMVSPRDHWQLNRTEPQGLELFEVVPEIRDVFVKEEWYDFICAFEGHHTGVALLFAQNFDGFQTQLGDTCIHITEHFIGAACALPVYGKDGLRKVNYHQNSAINSWCQSTKTLTGARVFPSHG
jgi:hypothetical protein